MSNGFKLRLREDGADVAFAVIDRVRREMLHRVGLADLLTPKSGG